MPLPMRPLLLWLASASFGLAQAVALPPFSSMTPEMMEKAINAKAMEPGGAERGRTLVQQAISKGRLDLVKVCFLNGYVQEDVRRAVAASPNTSLRHKAAIMMLRIDSTLCWPRDDPYVAFSGAPITGMVEPFVSTVATLLPGETLTKERVATKAARNQLADRLLAALIAQGGVISADEKPFLVASPAQPPYPAGQKEP